MLPAKHVDFPLGRTFLKQLYCEARVLGAPVRLDCQGDGGTLIKAGRYKGTMSRNDDQMEDIE